MQYFANSLGHGILFQEQDMDGLEFPEYPTGKVGVGMVSEKGAVPVGLGTSKNLM